VLAVCLLGLGASRADAAEAFSFESGRAHPSAARLVLAPRPGSSASLRVVFSTGRLDEHSEKHGMLRLAQHALLEAGARRYDALALSAFQAAASVDLWTGLSESGFTFTARRADFDALAPALLGQLLCPRLDADAFEDARERTLQDARWLTDVPYPEHVLTRLLVGDPNSDESSAPERQVLKELTAGEVLRFVRTQLAPARATVVAAGSFDARKLRAAVARCRGGSPREPLPAPVRPSVSGRAPAGADYRLYAYPVQVASARDAAGLRVLSAALGERLHERVRRKGLAYFVRVAPMLTPALDLLVVTFPLGGSARGELPELLAEIEQLAQAPLPEEELRRHRDAVLAGLRAGDASPQAVASELEVEASRPGWYGPQLVRELEALTPGALRELAGRWLGEQRRHSVRLGSDVKRIAGVAGSGTP
jgi:predicted Zn-dependent peptidase